MALPDTTPDTTFETHGRTVTIYGLHDDEYIFKLIKTESQFYESDLLDFVSRLPLWEGVVIDAGANLGNHTVFFSMIMERRTHAFEVSRTNLNLLRMNVAANGLTEQVTIHDYGLHSEPGTASIEENRDNMGQTRVVSIGTDPDNTVELRRLDDVIPADETVALIKVDVEGSELDVLLGARAILDRDRPLCVVEGHRGPGLSSIASLFADLSYSPAQILGRSANWIFVPDERRGFLSPYIAANVQRNLAAAIASNEARLRMLQGRLERLANQITESIVPIGLDVRENGARIDRLAITARELAESIADRMDSLSAQSFASSEQLATQIEVLEEAAERRAKANQIELGLLAETVRSQIDSLARRSFSRWAKDNIKALANQLATNKVTKRLIVTLVPRSVRRKAAEKLLGRRYPRRSALPEKTIQEPPTTPANPLPKSARYRSALICPTFPGGTRVYGGEFVQTRVQQYALRGHSVLVVESSPANTEPVLSESQILQVLRIPPSDLGFFLRFLAPRVDTFLTHSPSPETLAALSEVVEPDRQFHWFHGYDARDYRRLYFNYTTGELARLKKRLDAINRQRLAAVGDCIADSLSTKVFVSDFLKAIAEEDTGRSARNSHVIPNFIDGRVFRYLQKTPDQAKRILLIRAFSNHNYANDIAINAINLLRNRDGFEDLAFTIRGFGKHFKPLTDRVSYLSNVDVKEGHLAAEEIASLHATHGVFLCPSRFDTQGVSMGEAMASGLVCITNNVAAIPEYTDSESSVLARPDDPVAFAEAIWDICHDPERFARLSHNAANRVRRQCGLDQTIDRELALFSRVTRPGGRHDA